MKRYYTIGMAGHIDHGKTTLTKALTNIDTDRLQAEKDRSISIEPGYAPLLQTNELEVSIVDVPGHEKFIRQMIAGVAGIDAVILVIAADEGFMPQTNEHLHILHLLGIKKGIVAVTKADLIDEEMKELVEEDIMEHTENTFLEGSSIIFLDSVSKKGIPLLEKEIARLLSQIDHKNAGNGFRMPIDQSFSVKGHGTVVRGTIFDGSVAEGDIVTLLPQNKNLRVKQLQVHHENRKESSAGQRTALNLTGINYEEIERGNVLVKGSFPKTKVLDITLHCVPLFSHVLKQRAPVKIHIGTSEVYGKIVFFDRNELHPGQSKEILCQIRLDEEVIADRNDRFILRRPSPAETIGGGSVINPYGEKYRFGEETVEMLALQNQGSPEERITAELKKNKAVKKEDLLGRISVSTEELEAVYLHSTNFIVLEDWWLLAEEVKFQEAVLLDKLKNYHEKHPMRQGKNIAEINNDSPISEQAAALLTSYFEKNNKIKRRNEEIFLPEHSAGYPKQWKKRMEQAETRLISEGLQPTPFTEVIKEAGIPQEYELELRKFLAKHKMLELDDKHIISAEAVSNAVERLEKNTGEAFTLQEAKQTLSLSRKFLVPLLELLDREGLTKRENEKRIWKKPI